MAKLVTPNLQGQQMGQVIVSLTLLASTTYEL